MKNHLSKLIRPEVMEFKPYSPGLSIDEIRQKYKLDNVIKMASNENPLGTSPVVQEVIQKNASLAFRYPAAGNPDLCKAIGQYLNIDHQRIVCGNGSDEIIDLLIRVTAVPGRDNIVAFKPCFSIYKLQSRLCGVEFRQHALNNDFTFDWEGLYSLIDENTRIVFLTNPDNPSGHAVPSTELGRIAEKLPDSCILIIDEAYIDFASPVEEYSSLAPAIKSENIVVLRTFSKMFALAGMRLGYGIMPHFLADYLKRIRLPFSVNILAEKAGIAALNDQTFMNTTFELIANERQLLSIELEKIGCQVYPSQANFIMFKPPSNAWDIFEKLLSQGIIIRPLKSYGLPDHLRVSIGTVKENKTLIKSLKAILDEK
ncbi:MAG: histidinol-phosphate transaminase [Desulfonatronovibrio sp. MSAO_Bac4]|nr:MAG: histidinol-phosphate transaminase [Desulfonatronovibrio sp. MSAO_Bac4]